MKIRTRYSLIKLGGMGHKRPTMTMMDVNIEKDKLIMADERTNLVANNHLGRLRSNCQSNMCMVFCDPK